MEINYEAQYEEQKSLQNTDPNEFREYPEDLADGALDRPDEDVVDVYFLHERDEPRTVFAYFPTLVHNEPFKTCYAHVGQHSACSIEYARECKMAHEKSYSDLKKELEGLGYKLRIMNNWPFE